MDPFSDGEFSTPKGPGPRAHLPPLSSPISSALDSSPLQRMLGSSLYYVGDSISIENSAEETIEEEELEVVRGIRGVSGRLQERMAAVLKELRTQRMGIGTFIRAWVEQDDRRRARRVGLLRKLASQDPVLSEVFGPGEGNINGMFDSDVIRELNGLVDRPFFNKFKEEDRPEDIQYAGAYTELERSAPIWCGFLMQILQHSRAHQASYYQRKDLASVQQKAYLITSVICKARATNTSNYLSKTLGLYMISSGVKRRVINVLAGLGICDSYKPLNELYNRIADKGEVSNWDLIMAILACN
jgi:hypothetical protein